jgi:hypothetical protein
MKRAILLVIVVLFFVGCASTKEPTVVYKEVAVPIEIPGKALPVPDPVDCGDVPDGDWRDSAAYVKECFDKIVKKIEEYHHIIVSYNETR